MPPNLTTLRRAFVDVCRGYSLGHTKDSQTVYIRHLSHFGHQEYDLLTERFEQEALAKGAETEETSLKRLTDKGLWSPARETDIARQRDFIGRLEEGRKTIAVPSVLKSHEDQIARERDKLAQTLLERARLIGMTAELYAHRRLEDHYMVGNLFVDAALTTPLYAQPDFDTLTDEEVDAIHETYAKAIEPCSDANLRKLSVQDLFMSYFALCGDNPSALFGRPVCELTYYQVRLLNHGRYMKALLDNTDLNRLPPEQRGDPEAIERLHITQKNLAAMQAEGKAPVGMSAADVKATGVQFNTPPPPGLSGVELVKWMQRQQAMAPR